MTFTEIYQTALPWIVAYLPSISAIVGIIAACIKFFKDNKAVIQPIVTEVQQLKETVNDRREIDELKLQQRVLMQQLADQQKMIADLITVIGKVKYNEPNNKEI